MTHTPHEARNVALVTIGTVLLIGALMCARFAWVWMP